MNVLQLELDHPNSTFLYFFLEEVISFREKFAKNEEIMSEEKPKLRGF